MPGHASLPPAGLSGAQSLLKGQQVTKDAKMRRICQMEKYCCPPPLPHPLPMAIALPLQGVAQDVLRCCLLAQGIRHRRRDQCLLSRVSEVLGWEI